MTLAPLQVIGIAITLALIVAVSILSGRGIKSASDFDTGGGKGGALLVCGGITGALVGSQATIGTAQIAYQYGLSALWFTLGSCFGCIILALFYVVPLRRSGCVTVMQIISNEYGKRAEYTGSVLCSLGIFISVLAQLIACSGLITVLFPAISMGAAAAFSALIMALYVIFGGARAAGAGGILKLALLYLSSIIALVLVLFLSDGSLFNFLRATVLDTGIGQVQQALSLPTLSTPADISAQFFNLLARGPFKDLGSGLSLILGVLSTQTYIQAVLTGKSNSAAKKGALLSAFLIPLIGIAATLVGLYMRATTITHAELDALTAAGQAIPNLPILEKTIQAFPMFVIQHMPPLLGGIILGTLIISVIGGGAGLSLGVSTILVNDIYKKLSPRFNDSLTARRATRLTIVACLAIAAALAAAVPGALINDFGFLSMGLRGATVFIPMSCALFFKKRIAPKYALASIIAGPLAVLVGNFTVSFDPLIIGLAICIGIMCIGAHRTPRANLSPR